MVVEPMVRERAAFQLRYRHAAQRLAARWPQLSFDHVEEIGGRTDGARKRNSIADAAGFGRRPGAWSTGNGSPW